MKRKETFKVTKREIRICKWKKNRQHNGKKKTDKKKMIYKTLHKHEPE